MDFRTNSHPTSPTALTFASTTNCPLVLILLSCCMSVKCIFCVKYVAFVASYFKVPPFCLTHGRVARSLWTSGTTSSLLRIQLSGVIQGRYFIAHSNSGGK